MAYDNTNRGVLFQNGKKEGKQPDYRGTLDVGGKEFEIAGWKKVSKNGKPFLAITVSEPFKKDGKKPEQKKAPVDDDMNQDIPF